MRVQLRFFASLRESLGARLEIDVAEGADVGHVRDTLIGQGEPYQTALARGRAVRAAVNQSLCEESQRLQPGDELAFFPPVTGG